jgi:hypothetical protein
MTFPARSRNLGWLLGASSAATAGNPDAVGLQHRSPAERLADGVVQSVNVLDPL